MNAAGFAALLEELRPRVHRYCARMVGSSVEGEDVLQEGYLHALSAFERTQPRDPTAWVFTIVHRAALDVLRRTSRLEAMPIDDEEQAMGIAPDEALALQASLRTLMELPTRQRAVVVLTDVLGHSNEEVRDLIGLTEQATKALLHRGRTRLRELGALRDVEPHPALTAQTRSLVDQYVERFNARDFEGVRALLAEEVRVEVVRRVHLQGRDMVSSNYIHNYADTHDWRFVAGTVDGHPAMISVSGGVPQYFVLLAFEAGRVCRARDFRYARYAVDGAVIHFE